MFSIFKRFSIKTSFLGGLKKKKAEFLTLQPRSLNFFSYLSRDVNRQFFDLCGFVWLGIPIYRIKVN